MAAKCQTAGPCFELAKFERCMIYWARLDARQLRATLCVCGSARQLSLEEEENKRGESEHHNGQLMIASHTSKVTILWPRKPVKLAFGPSAAIARSLACAPQSPGAREVARNSSRAEGRRGGSRVVANFWANRDARAARLAANHGRRICVRAAVAVSVRVRASANGVPSSYRARDHHAPPPMVNDKDKWA